MKTIFTTFGICAFSLLALAAAPGAPAQAATGFSACGSAPNGLDVQASKKSICAVAMKVAAAWAKRAEKEGDGPMRIAVDGQTWLCRERQGNPNPYQECKNKANAKEIMKLGS